MSFNSTTPTSSNISLAAAEYIAVHPAPVTAELLSMLGYDRDTAERIGAALSLSCLAVNGSLTHDSMSMLGIGVHRFHCSGHLHLGCR